MVPPDSAAHDGDGRLGRLGLCLAAAMSCLHQHAAGPRRAAAGDVQPAVADHHRLRGVQVHLAARLFNGSPSLLVLNVLDDEDLGAEERARLKDLIKDA